MTNKHAITNLREALRTYIDRNKVYGDNYKKFGNVMAALYPLGITLKTVEDFNRFGVIVMKVSKLSRYTTNPMVGHIDSTHDDIVYSAMLEELDSEAQGMDTTSPVELVTTVDPLDKPYQAPSFCDQITLTETPRQPIHDVFIGKEKVGGCVSRDSIDAAMRRIERKHDL